MGFPDFNALLPGVVVGVDMHAPQERRRVSSITVNDGKVTKVTMSDGTLGDVSDVDGWTLAGVIELARLSEESDAAGRLTEPSPSALIIEIGKRYRYVRPDGKTEDVLIEDGRDGDGWIATDLGRTSNGGRKGFFVFDLRNGGVVRNCVTGDAQGHLEELQKEPPAKLAPILGDDPGALGRLRERFKNWDFSTGTY